MAKFLSRLFSNSGSSKRSSSHGSHPSINAGSRSGGFQSGMRGATSLDNLSSYDINPKELAKNKLHKASWEGDLSKVERFAQPGVLNAPDHQRRVIILHCANFKILKLFFIFK